MDFSKDDDTLTTSVTQVKVSEPQDNLSTLQAANNANANDLYENSPFMHVRGFPYASQIKKKKAVVCTSRFFLVLSGF